MWEVFKKRVITGINRFIPKVKDFRHGKEKHWNQPLDGKTRQLIKEKSRLWARYIETRRDDILQKYKTVRNKLRWETRQIARMECDKIAA
jgi:adenine specific DNA methylase Mod